jgi:urea transport system permease protein
MASALFCCKPRRGHRSFAADDYSETDAGIGAVAASGDPRSAAFIEALQDGRLLFSAEQKSVF